MTISFVGPIRKEKISLRTTQEVSEDIFELRAISHLPYIFAKGNSVSISYDLPQTLTIL